MLHVLLRNPVLTYRDWSLDWYLDATYELPESHGYFEEFVPADIEATDVAVKTEDGYVLSMFVLKHKTRFDASLPPVLFQHGFGSSALSWLITDQSSSAFLFCKKGYAVYLLNGRGSPLSLRHQKFSYRMKEFWDFTFEDLGFDTIAALDYMHAQHGKKAVYVGHSQGAIQMMASLADDRFRSRLSEKLLLTHLLAPVICMSRSESSVLKMIGNNIGLVTSVVETLGIFKSQSHRLPDGYVIRAIEHFLNRLCSIDKRICFLGFSGQDKHNDLNSLDRYGTWTRFHLTSLSLKSMLHFSQVYRSSLEQNCLVRRYDYGSDEKNTQKYGSAIPPAYNFTSIPVQSIFYFGTADRYFTEPDIEDFAALIERIPQASIQTFQNWGHMTFKYGIDVSSFYESVEADTRSIWTASLQ